MTHGYSILCILHTVTPVVARSLTLPEDDNHFVDPGERLGWLVSSLPNDVTCCSTISVPLFVSGPLLACYTPDDGPMFSANETDCVSWNCATRCDSQPVDRLYFPIVGLFTSSR